MFVFLIVVIILFDEILHPYFLPSTRTGMKYILIFISLKKNLIKILKQNRFQKHKIY